MHVQLQWLVKYTAIIFKTDTVFMASYKPKSICILLLTSLQVH